MFVDKIVSLKDHIMLPLIWASFFTQCCNLLSKECLLFVCAVYVSTLLCLP